MHPNVFMKLSSELQVMCHLSKVQLRNFWTWIQMILRIFCGNKGTVLPFSYWICCFCRFQSAPDFLRSWAFTATCLASACDFSSAVRQLLTSNRRAWGFEQNLWLLFFELVQVFWTGLDIYRIHLEEYHEPVFCTYNRFIRWYTVIFSVHTWITEDAEGESKKNLVHFRSILIVSPSNTAWPLMYLKLSSWELINTM